MTAATLLSLDSVGLDVGSRRILDGISLDIEQGQILTIIGPNGGGKSSLLKIILGLYQPSRGQCRRHQPLRIGYMPQQLHIDANLPLQAQRLLALSDGDPAAHGDLLARVGVSHLLTQSVQSLSGGEFQRLLLARALLRRPNLLVLDEPAQGVDLQGQQTLYRLLSELRDELGFALVMVSHDLHFVMASTDQVLCLNQHVCCSGSAELVSRHPAYLDLFGSRDAEAIAFYTHHHDHQHNLHGDVVAPATHTHASQHAHKPHQHGPGCQHD